MQYSGPRNTDLGFLAYRLREMLSISSLHPFSNYIKKLIPFVKGIFAIFLGEIAVKDKKGAFAPGVSSVCMSADSWRESASAERDQGFSPQASRRGEK